MSLCVLLLEDDRDLRETLRLSLQTEGYRVLAAASLADAHALWRHARAQETVDLVLLDLGLHDGDGRSFLEAVRQQGATPVLVISARQQEQEKVGLLDLGADDYLVKPFSISELLARMRVAWRHRGRTVQAAVRQWSLGSVQIDLDRHVVTRDAMPVHLTPTEFKLLSRLVRSAGQVVTHRQLLVDVWGAEFIEHTHYLRLYMGQLRAKLEADPTQPVFLHTEPGVGYRLADGI